VHGRSSGWTCSMMCARLGKVRQSTSLLGSILYIILAVCVLSSVCKGSCIRMAETSFLLFKDLISFITPSADSSADSVSQWYMCMFYSFENFCIFSNMWWRRTLWCYFSINWCNWKWIPIDEAKSAFFFM
jgi:hypothetical protein